MIYSVKLNGKSYELPKKTLAVGHRLERFSELPVLYEKKELKLEEVLQEQYEFIVESLGNENAAALIGTEILEEADIDDVTFTVMAIVKAYTEKAMKAQLDNQVAPYRAIMADKDVQKAVDLISKAK